MSISEIATLFTGVALFLFGMSLMGDGLKRVSGSKLEPILFHLTGTPFRGILLGAGVTAVIQSSSATSVMVVGFVNSKMMKVRQAIPVILGAILGTSITGWVVCLSYMNGPKGISSIFSTTTLTGIIAVTGIFFRMFCKNQQRRHVGDILLGFSVLMVGMSSMSGAVSSLGEQPWFTKMLTSMTFPLLGILVGLVFSSVLQSASAAVGIVQALSFTGVMTLGSSLPLLMGISIGASVPVLLSALGATTDGKRTAVSYLVASFMGVMVCASAFYIADAMFHFDFLDMIVNPMSLALVNTILRFTILLILAPFTDVLEAVASVFVPGKPEEKKEAVRLEERFLAHPALAIEQTRLTICDMATKTEESILTSLSLFNHYNESIFYQVCELENVGDRYEDALGSYLVRLTGQELTESQGRTASLYLHTLSDFERISDHAQNIAQSFQEVHQKQIHFSDEAIEELSVMTKALKEILRMTTEAFVKQDAKLAMQVEPLEEVIDDLCDKMKLRHVERLQKGQCTITQGFVFNDLSTNFERVSDHCSNIAVAIIEMEAESFDTHEYLGRIKEKQSPDYQKYYENYSKQFTFD
ncbi:MAG: Na/Pi cotransporter family protein [Clostridiales bacterium]|nr:Na/Pi cotransporter family protein [Clostridiales bacterium]MBQ6270864.1 Na/Pi cotransporter family protein [Clostridiales bacterium]MBR4010579.1 Na/Pi cotransporter family protein [Clostridiales bacterium]